jgi:uncharacterized protein with GYD domain
MAHYLLEVTYTPNAWATMLANPQNRIDAVRPVIERFGGTLEHAWFAFGDYDLVCIYSMPGNVGAAAFSLAVTAGGAVKSCKTVPLMTVEEGIQAMKMAAGSGYFPPKSEAQR